MQYDTVDNMDNINDFAEYKEQELKERKLPDKEWRKSLDEYLINKTMKADDFEMMSTQQRIIINEIKKSYNRNKEIKWRE